MPDDADGRDLHKPAKFKLGFAGGGLAFISGAINFVLASTQLFASSQTVFLAAGIVLTCGGLGLFFWGIWVLTHTRPPPRRRVEAPVPTSDAAVRLTIRRRWRPETDQEPCSLYVAVLRELGAARTRATLRSLLAWLSPTLTEPPTPLLGCRDVVARTGKALRRCAGLFRLCLRTAGLRSIRLSAISAYKALLQSLAGRAKAAPGDPTPDRVPNAAFLHYRHDCEEVLQAECVHAANLAADLLSDHAFIDRWADAFAREFLPLPFLYGRPNTLEQQAKRVCTNLACPVPKALGLRGWLLAWRMALSPSGPLINLAAHLGENDYSKHALDALWPAFLSVWRASLDTADRPIHYVRDGLTVLKDYLGFLRVKQPSWDTWQGPLLKSINDWRAKHQPDLDGDFLAVAPIVDGIIEALRPFCRSGSIDSHPSAPQAGQVGTVSAPAVFTPPVESFRPTNVSAEGQEGRWRWNMWQEAVDILARIPPGREKKAAGQYHDFILEALRYVFEPRHLRDVKREGELHKGRMSVDIVAANVRENGFFHWLQTSNVVPCNTIFFECKNYFKDPKNPDIAQVASRFGPDRGKYGYLICRTVEAPDTMAERCEATLNDDRGWIIVLDDGDIKTLLQLRGGEKWQEIDDFLRERHERLANRARGR